MLSASKIEECIDFVMETCLHDGGKKEVLVTGGGALKYSSRLEERLGVSLAVKDEMECTIMGLNFFLHNVPFESYTFDPNPKHPNPRSFVPIGDNVYPYLLVQIGSGVSVLKVDDEHTFSRVDGTSLGGGDNREVDLVVGDIYGADYSKIGLNADVLASSFGKIMYNLNGEAADKSAIRAEDMALSLLKMVSNNIAQIAYLNAMRYNIKHIYFGGFFIRDQPITMAKISYGVNYWSKGTMRALFLLHEGYLGAVGAFLKNEKCEKIFSPFGHTRERAERLHLEQRGEGYRVKTQRRPTDSTSSEKGPMAVPDSSSSRSGDVGEVEEEEEGVGMDSSDWVQRIDQNFKEWFNFPLLEDGSDEEEDKAEMGEMPQQHHGNSNHVTPWRGGEGGAANGETNSPTMTNEQDGFREKEKNGICIGRLGRRNGEDGVVLGIQPGGARQNYPCESNADASTSNTRNPWTKGQGAT